MQYNKDNPLKVFEAFAGYGSQSVALERLKRKHPGFDYKVVGISEIEMNAIAAYNALHGHPTPPPNFGSITEIDWSHVPNFDLLTYSFPCFVADTLILTDKGYKPIQDVQRGELVMTHLGRFKRVNAVMQREYNGPLINIKAKGLRKIVCTLEHPFYVTELKSDGFRVRYTEPTWKKARYLERKWTRLLVPMCDYADEDLRQHSSLISELLKADGTFSDGKYAVTPITKINAQYAETTVYNLSVEDDESYVANGVAVHNCQDISASGLQKGFDEDSSTRSSLLWQVRKAVVAKRPKFLLMENVKALTQKKFMPLFNKWQQELEHYGYTNFYKVLNATQFNVPQNRERVFMVSVLEAEQDYQFPKPIELTKVIADVLEQEVDEQYFLNQHVVEKYLEVTADTTHNHNLGLRSRSDIAFTIRAKAGGRVDDNYIAYVEEK